MKFEIVLNGERKEVEAKGLKSKHIDQLVDLMSKLEDGNTSMITEYRNKLDEVIGVITSLTIEELGELDIDDKQKFIDYVTKKLQSSLGFTKP